MAEKTELEKILAYSVDVKNRRIYFGDVDDGDEGSYFAWDSVEMAIRSMHYLSSLNKKPIELHMSSYGGDAYEMLRLYDAIQACPCQVKFFGSGVICSSASYIMCGCDERYLTPHTTVMVHKGTSPIGQDNHTDVIIEAKECIELDRKCNEIYAANSRMPFDFWDEMTKRDIWLSPEETVMLGLADKIIPPKKRGNLRRARIAIMNQPVDRKEMSKLVRRLAKRIEHSKTLKIEIDIPKEEYDKDVIVEKETPEKPDQTTAPNDQTAQENSQDT